MALKSANCPIWHEKGPTHRSNGHFQMTLFDLRVNIEIIFSVYSIYVTYLFRPVDLTAIWLLVQEIQGPEICEMSNLA